MPLAMIHSQPLLIALSPSHFHAHVHVANKCLGRWMDVRRLFHGSMDLVVWGQTLPPGVKEV
jgi:hypothetical protein